MIKLKNNYKLDFICASGALGWYGEGWWWERPLRWLGFICSEELTVVSKTLTFEPVVGNLRWWCPWRCVRLIKGGAVNAVGLTNPGYRWWIEKIPARIEKKGWKVIPSIMPKTREEAAKMAKAFSKCPIVGIEINLSCPNVEHDASVRHAVDIVETVLENTDFPVIVKLGYQDPFKEICLELDGKVDAFDLINAVTWDKVFPGKPSPLKKYNLSGAVSGSEIVEYARDALAQVKIARVKTPIISGGGIDCEEEIYARRVMGASGYSLGVIFLRKPWLPKKIIRECRRTWRYK